MQTLALNLFCHRAEKRQNYFVTSNAKAADIKRFYDWVFVAVP